jgi:hypothetical protein
MDIEDYGFMGLANTVAMEEFSASFDDDRDNTACMALLQEYKDAGSPTNRRDWLRDRLSSFFVCLDACPEWAQCTPMWPFYNAQPMVFIGQVAVPECDVSRGRLAPDTVLYVFGIRVVVEGGWEMRYQVVQQDPSLP